MGDFDLKLYLKLVGADKDVQIGDTPNLNLLKLLVKFHVLNVPYQNYDLLLSKDELDISPSALLQRLLVEKRGGMCYESSELMLHVLKEFKFDARRIPVFCMVNAQVYKEGMTNNHNIILVVIEDKKYLVDNGFSYNSIREPVEFGFKETEEITVRPYEKYRLECAQDYYKLDMWLKDSWAPMYRFKRPLEFMDLQECLDNYRQFLITNEIILIRDSVLKVGILTETGRLGFMCLFDAKQQKGGPNYSKVSAQNNEPAVSEKVTYEEFRDSIKPFTNLPLDDKLFTNV